MREKIYRSRIPFCSYLSGDIWNGYGFFFLRGLIENGDVIHSLFIQGARIPVVLRRRGITILNPFLWRSRGWLDAKTIAGDVEGTGMRNGERFVVRFIM